MFEELMGLPAHPLLVHAAVVLVPLLALLTIAYAVVPFVRPHIRVVLGLLALATPITTLLVKLSGDAFFTRLQDRDQVSPEFFPKIVEHQQLGTKTLYATIVLALLTLALVYFVAPRIASAQAASGAARGGGGSSRALPLVLAVLSVVAAGVSLYYVARTGDAGARLVWEGS